MGRMSKKRGEALFVLVLAVLMAAGTISFGLTDYMLYDNHGGAWHDAEKSSDNSEDDLMCWAATSANILRWTGWGGASGMTNTDQIFSYYQDHWTDAGGIMEFGWEWWFSGTNPSQGEPWTSNGWSQVDVAGGAFHPTENFSEHYYRTWDDASAMSAINDYLHAGYGTGIGVYGPGGHAITVWGYRYGTTVDDYVGIWVSDSDDDRSGSAPRPDSLRYYDVQYSSGAWYLQSFYGSNNWYIGEVQALDSVPEPTTILLISLGGLLLRKRK